MEIKIDRTFYGKISPPFQLVDMVDKKDGMVKHAIAASLGGEGRKIRIVDLLVPNEESPINWRDVFLQATHNVINRGTHPDFPFYDITPEVGEEIAEEARKLVQEIIDREE